MLEINKGCGKTRLEPEFKDVIVAKDLGVLHIVEDWPWGRNKRCTMSFSVEKNKRGERFVKQSRMDGRLYKPKAGTYATGVKIVEIDGKVGHVRWHIGYGHFGASIEDSKYFDRVFYDEEAKALAEKFFKGRETSVFF